MKMNLEQLWQSLGCCSMQTAIDLLGPWVSCALPGEVELLLDTCPKALRGHLAVLLCDLLSGWPNGLVGVPVLLWCAHSEDIEPLMRRVVLPGMEAQCSQAGQGLTFLGWLHKDALLPAVQVQAGRLAEVEVGVGDAAVALFRVADGVEVEKVEGMELRPVWWGELLDGVAGSVYISVGVVQSYPVALEVARAMSLAAGDSGTGLEAATGVFATHGEVRAGIEAGMLFRGRAEAALGAAGSLRAGVDDDELI